MVARAPPLSVRACPVSSCQQSPASAVGRAPPRAEPRRHPRSPDAKARTLERRGQHSRRLRSALPESSVKSHRCTVPVCLCIATYEGRAIGRGSARRQVLSNKQSACQGRVFAPRRYMPIANTYQHRSPRAGAGAAGLLWGEEGRASSGGVRGARRPFCQFGLTARCGPLLRLSQSIS